MDASLLGQLTQYGVLGVFAVLLVLFARTLLKREQDRGDASAAEVTRLNSLVIDKIIPALITATQAISASQQILQSIQYQRDLEAAVAKKSGEQQR